MGSLKTKTIMVVSLASCLVLVPFLTVMLPTSANAIHNCNSPHCFAEARKDASTSGGWARLTVGDLNVVDCDNDFVANPMWMVFPDGDWVEIGVIQGILSGVGCQAAERIYTWARVDGSSTGMQHGAATIGTTYSLSMDDVGLDTQWLLKKNQVNLRTVNNMGGSTAQQRVGLEMDRNTSSAGTAHFSDIRYFASGQTFLWTSGISLPLAHAPPARLVCTNYYHIHFGTGTLTPC